MHLNKHELIDKMRSRGLKPTSQRIAILLQLLSRKDHPSTDAIYHSLKDEYPTLSLNTIYMSLESFAEKGLISKINVLHDSARFDGDIRPHHHFVCVRCRKIIDLFNVKIPPIKIPKELKTAKIFFQQLRINGICEACR